MIAAQWVAAVSGLLVALFNGLMWRRHSRHDDRRFREIYLRFSENGKENQ